MNYLQLGNGGAFDFDQTNSSFMIDLEGDRESLLLFDCGHSVFAELIRSEKEGLFNLDNLDYVYISHMDDDHIGSLKTLIYYMYFVRKKVITVVADQNVWGMRRTVSGAEIKTMLEEYLSDIDSEMKFGRKIKTQMFRVLKPRVEFPEKISKHCTIQATRTNHGKTCFGVLIKNERKNYNDFNDNIDRKSIFISGDTKACNYIKVVLHSKKPDVILHDFSNWNEEDSQVHACQTDFNRTYRDLKCFDSIIKYHNGEPFEKKWKPVE